MGRPEAVQLHDGSQGIGMGLLERFQEAIYGTPAGAAVDPQFWSDIADRFPVNGKGRNNLLDFLKSASNGVAGNLL